MLQSLSQAHVRARGCWGICKTWHILPNYVSILHRMGLLCWLLKPKMHMFKHLLKRTQKLRPLPQIRQNLLEMHVLILLHVRELGTLMAKE